jgi:hypothetical protein
MPSTLARGVLVLLAAGVVAWAALSYYAVGAEQDARKLANRVAFGHVPSAQINQAVDDLHRAERYSLSNGPLVAEGVLVYAAGRRREASEIARRATAAEPDNLDARFLEYSAAPDARSRAAAKREVARLNPWAGDSLP